MTERGELPPLRDVIARLKLSARRSLGQNFILDLNLTRRIARAGGPLDEIAVVEIGPGPGGLTRALLMEGAECVIAIERDRRCIPALDEIIAFYPGRLQVIETDALNLDYHGLLDRPGRIIANLPYGIATALLTGWLSTQGWPPWCDRMILMFQREVAERITSPPGSKRYGRLSVLAQWRTRPRILFSLPPRAFTPPPKVESSLVELIPFDTPEDCGSVRMLEAVTAAAFGQRRKMLKTSLKSLIPDPVALLDEAGIAASLRAEQITVSQFCSLARILSQAGKD